LFSECPRSAGKSLNGIRSSSETNNVLFGIARAVTCANYLIDEAHRLNTKFLAEKGVETSTARLARESGKFNGRLIVASQSLTDFPAGFSANFGNILCFRTPSGADLQALEHMSGIGLGQLQTVMNGLKKGEALLIGPHGHYAAIRVNPPPEANPPENNKNEPGPGTCAGEPGTGAGESGARMKEDVAGPDEPEEPDSDALQLTDSEVPRLEVLPGAPVTPYVSREERILQALREEGALTEGSLAMRLHIRGHSLWKRLQILLQEGKVVRHEEVEIPGNREIFYEISNPHSQQSGFHDALIEKARAELAKAGEVKVLTKWGNPDLIFNGRVAVEVETGMKDDLGPFAGQMEKRFGQGYGAIIVITINKRQRKRYEDALAGAQGGLKNVVVVTFRELAKTAAKVKS